MEYKDFAKHYDEFYSKKDYQREVDFLKQLLGDKKTILDVGCGTGIHMNLLEQCGYQVEGIDLNEEMLEIAQQRVKGPLYVGNMLDFNLYKKYDVIISMFAVINHLFSYDDLERVLFNFYKHLNEDGLIIMDLHSPQISGSKTDTVNGNTRVMEWTVNNETEIESSTIEYIVDGKSYKTSHQFKMFKIDKIKDLVIKLGYAYYQFYENYTTIPAKDTSKNIQVVLKK